MSEPPTAVSTVEGAPPPPPVPPHGAALSPRVRAMLVCGGLVVLLASLAALLPVPYVVLSPGPVTDTLGAANGRPLITISGRTTYPTSGQLDLTTVSVSGGPGSRMDLVTALRAWLDRREAIVPEEQVYPPGETAKQVEEENASEMRQSQQSATLAALRELGIAVPSSVVVAKVAPGVPAAGVLETGDVVRAVAGRPVTTLESLRTTVGARTAGEKVAVVVERGGERRTLQVPLTTSQGRTVLGIEVREDADLPFTVDIQLDEVGGPSAGLMFALGIYDKLTPGELTDGRHVAGTGTIDGSGKVGPIGGIQQKMLGARSVGATVFFVPADNCAEARPAAPKGLRLVRVAQMKDALAALEALDAGRAGIPSC